MVGAYRKQEGTDDEAGAAYVYYYNGVSWGSEKRLTASTHVTKARFGYSVSISGDYIIVGAPYPFDDDVEEAAYVYHRTNLDEWDVDVAELNAADDQPGDDFALSVGINSEFAVIGAIHGGEGAINLGSAYVFYRTSATDLAGKTAMLRRLFSALEAVLLYGQQLQAPEPRGPIPPGCRSAGRWLEVTYSATPRGFSPSRHLPFSRCALQIVDVAEILMPAGDFLHGD